MGSFTCHMQYGDRSMTQDLCHEDGYAELHIIAGMQGLGTGARRLPSPVSGCGLDRHWCWQRCYGAAWQCAHKATHSLVSSSGRVCTTVRGVAPPLLLRVHIQHWQKSPASDGKQAAHHPPASRRHTPALVPRHWEAEVKKQLNKDIRKGILEPVPVGEATEWCARMVVVAKKSGHPRHTIDYQKLNATCRRETQHTLTPFDIVSGITRHTYKTTPDAHWSFHQVELQEAHYLHHTMGPLQVL